MTKAKKNIVTKKSPRTSKPKKEPTEQLEPTQSKPTTLLEIIKNVYFSIPTRPIWIGSVFVIAYSYIRPIPISRFDQSIGLFILGLSTSIGGYLAIQRKEYPNWSHMRIGAQAIILGWITLVGGLCLAIPELVKLIFNQ
jgi:hypothetical protein